MIATLALAALLQDSNNALTAAEQRAGWKLLFDGVSTKGWHNYRTTGVHPGWVVKDGTLICDAEKHPGDIVTDELYDWFELSLEFKLGKDQNSGIILRATNEGETMWQSGPEVQLYDHPAEDGVEISGYLYQLYKSETDSQKPAGEWNKLRIVIAPTKCETYLNGVKYYEFVWGSEDFWARVKASKFARYPYFAKAEKGMIGLQGDHGAVTYRNIKIRPIVNLELSNLTGVEPMKWRGIGG
jgi:hypothetical protein